MPGTHTGNKQTQARIFHLLLAEQSLTRQEIAETLHLSMPTAAEHHRAAAARFAGGMRCHPIDRRTQSQKDLRPCAGRQNHWH